MGQTGVSRERHPRRRRPARRARDCPEGHGAGSPRGRGARHSARWRGLRITGSDGDLVRSPGGHSEDSPSGPGPSRQVTRDGAAGQPPPRASPIPGQRGGQCSRWRGRVCETPGAPQTATRPPHGATPCHLEQEPRPRFLLPALLTSLPQRPGGSPAGGRSHVDNGLGTEVTPAISRPGPLLRQPGRTHHGHRGVTLHVAKRQDRAPGRQPGPRGNKRLAGRPAHSLGGPGRSVGTGGQLLRARRKPPPDGERACSSQARVRGAAVSGLSLRCRFPSLPFSTVPKTSSWRTPGS